MIPAPGIEDQELSIAAERTSVNYPAVTRRCNLCAGPRRQRNAFFYAAGAVGTAEIADLWRLQGVIKAARGGRKRGGGGTSVFVFKTPPNRTCHSGLRQGP